MDILFIPFASREKNGNLIDMAARWQAAYATHVSDGAHASWPTQVENKVYSPGVPVLDGVNSSDVLFILAHGQGNQFVCATPEPETFVLDASALASRVKQSGLTSRHRKIVLSICNTNATLSDFATRFRWNMWQLNYSGALEVYYYAASVSIPRVLAGGGIGQTVFFDGTRDTLVPTPSGLARAGRVLDAAPFLYAA